MRMASLPVVDGEGLAHCLGAALRERALTVVERIGPAGLSRIVWLEI